MSDNSQDETVTDKDSRRWGEKRHLASRRHSVTTRLTIGGYKLFLTVGQYPDGTPAEIFVALDKQGGMLATITDSWCITFSFCLQWGVPLRTLVDKFLWTRCEPNGEVTGHPDVVKAYSIPDLIVRVLAIEYLGIQEVGNSPKLLAKSQSDKVESLEDGFYPISKDEQAKLEGFEGGVCDDCGSHKLKRTGVCVTCEDCGRNVGCS